MMELFLNIPIEVKVNKAGEEGEVLNITAREFTLQEKRERKSKDDAFRKTARELEKLQRENLVLSEKIALNKELGNTQKALDGVEQMERLEESLDEIIIKIEKMGGEDRGETLAKERFDIQIGGKDVEKFLAYAEQVGYVKVMKLIDEEKESAKKK